jgi:hypothetical protein
LQKRESDTQSVNLHSDAGVSILYENLVEAIPHFRNAIGEIRYFKELH